MHSPEEMLSVEAGRRDCSKYAEKAMAEFL
jgi:hypothetical protein